MQEWLFAGLGLVILLLAGDALVKGAVNLSLRVGIPALIVSLTVVAFGTSAPELLISVSAVLDDAPGIAIGNVVGSNTANVLLVLGFPALFAVMHTSECETRKNYLYMLVGSLLFIALCFAGPLTWWHGLILLAALSFVLGNAALDARAHRNGVAAAEVADEIEGVDPDMPWRSILFYLALGLAGLPIGADMLVESSVVIARTFGVSETVIGLTLVAIGTSLPELATTVMAALRRQADVALGNVIGSNMFNLLAIIGIASLVGPIPVDREILHFDLWVMLAASLALIPFVFLRQDITRVWGIVFSGLYITYLVVVIL
jgi:cation:H+ antiporter